MQADADYERMDALNGARRRLGRTLREAAAPRLEATLVQYPFRSAARDPAAAILAQPLPVDLDRSVAEVKDLAVNLYPDLHPLSPIDSERSSRLWDWTGPLSMSSDLPMKGLVEFYFIAICMYLIDEALCIKRCCMPCRFCTERASKSDTWPVCVCRTTRS